MTRTEIFTESIKAQTDEFLINELTVRARAAATLSEECSVSGVTISGGCTEDGHIRVEKGIERLAAVTDKELELSIAQAGEKYVRKTLSLSFGGAVFEQSEYEYVKDV